MSRTITPDDLVIRRLRRDEIDAYLRFRIVALEQTPTAFTSTAAEERERPTSLGRDRIENPDCPDDFVLGARIGGDIVGIAGFSRFVQQQSRHKGLLFGMAVARSAAGCGIGRRLVDTLLDQARAIDGLLQVVLTVSEDNPAAARLYLACGFREFGRESRAVIVNGIPIAKIHMVRMLDT